MNSLSNLWLLLLYLLGYLFIEPLSLRECKRSHLGSRDIKNSWSCFRLHLIRWLWKHCLVSLVIKSKLLAGFHSWWSLGLYSCEIKFFVRFLREYVGDTLLLFGAEWVEFVSHFIKLGFFDQGLNIFCNWGCNSLKSMHSLIGKIVVPCSLIKSPVESLNLRDFPTSHHFP